jgi:hypothetical protein
VAPDDTKEVRVTGGKGVVVGDYTTVFQVYGQAPAVLSSLILTRAFQPLVDERTRRFLGRDFVFRAIDENLADADFPSGYVVIQGEPGIGKTSLLAHLVKTRGWIHHFNVASLGIRSPRTFLSDVCAQLIVRYGLDHAVLPPAATEDGAFLARLLWEAAALPEARPVVIALDALDEAEDANVRVGANRLFLPPSLPGGVFIVITTRPQYDYQLAVDRRRDIYLRDDDPQNLEDVGAYIRDALATPDGKLEREVAAWGASAEEFVDRLTAKSEGNFMYLVNVLADIRSGLLSAATVGSIGALPQGLTAYYRRHWNHMRSADQERFRSYEEPVICLLATVREPVSIRQVVDWTRYHWETTGRQPDALDEGEVANVVHEWRQFFDADDGETRYRVYHASFRDFLKNEVGLNTYHRVIGDAALAKIPGFLQGA